MCEKLRLFGTANDSIVDGPGIRYAVFVQGCPHHCPGCHNPESHNPAGGYEESIETILAAVKKNPLLDGVTLSGGEPFSQAKPLASLAAGVKKLGLNIVIYTGYTFETLLAGANQENGWLALLEQGDLLIDGPFLQEQKSYDLLFKGSANQRILNLPQSLKEGRPVLDKSLSQG